MTDGTFPSTPGGRIVALLKRSDVRPTELAEALELPQQVTLDDVATGSYALSAADLVAAAEALDVPVGVLTGKVPLDRHLGVSLRLGAAEDVEVPLEALEYAERMLAHKALLDSWFGRTVGVLDKIPYSNRRHHVMAGRLSAERIRDALGLGCRPIGSLTALLESLGLPVSFRKLPDGVCGLNLRDERDGYVSRLIIVSTRSSWTRQRYTLAHELCHAFYDDKDQIIVDRVDVPDRWPEIRAESFARHLILPVKALRAEVVDARQAGTDWVTIVAHLMMDWGISRPAVIRALIDDGLASGDELDSARQGSISELMRRVGLTSKWNECAAQQSEASGSQFLVERAVQAYGNGWVSASVVADVVGQDLARTEAELGERGWGAP